PPNGTFAMFHGFLAVVAVSLISGSFAERMKFKAFLLFSTLWVFFVYTPLAHWVWGGGWTGGVLGALDFAGGIPIQISAGAAALVAAYVVKPRKGYGIDPMPPHNRTTALAGAALMWFGWIGLNAGSANGAGTLAAFALVNTNVSAAASALCWCLIERLHRGKSTLVGMAGGLIAGLAAASPAAGYVHPLSSIAIGVVAGVLSYIAISLKPRIGYDDAFDVFGIHAVGGTWGMLATGLFASREINPSGLDGLFHGNPPLLGIQAAAIIAAYIYVVIYTFVILKIVDWTIGLRVSGEDEIAGMDQTQHGERAYNLRGDKY
ncbi:MAG: ammonium transporter, partial [Deltaproteobacteria bacterium]|nr:ammonium transporter [Deltaproteobacteria bacterium]